jgi:DNA polymerase III subunit delta
VSLSPERCLDEILGGVYKPLYLFLGEEIDWKESVLSRIRSQLNDRYSVQSYQAADGLSGILDQAKMVPMLDEGHVFFIRDVERLPESDLAQLAAYMEKPSSFCRIILTLQKADRRKKSWKALLALGESVDFVAMRADQLRQWLSDMAKQDGRSLSSDAAEFLVGQAGGRLDEVGERYRLLCLYLAENEPITREHCQDLFMTVREESIWELVDAIIAHRPMNAISAAVSLLDSGSAPQQLLAFLYGRFRLASLAHYHLAKGGRPDDLAKALGSSPFALKKLLPWGRKWDEEQWSGVRRLFAKADQRMKTTGGKPEHILEHLVCQLANA